MIAPGKYRARCTGAQDAQWAKSQNGNTKLVLVFELLDGQHQGQRISWVGTFTENTYERILDSLEYCGLNQGTPLDELQGIENNEVELDVIHEVGNDGKTYAHVKWINRANAGRIRFKEPLAPTDAKAAVREFDALWRSRSKGAAVGFSQSRSTAAQAPKTVAGGDDDIPF